MYCIFIAESAIAGSTEHTFEQNTRSKYQHKMGKINTELKETRESIAEIDRGSVSTIAKEPRTSAVCSFHYIFIEFFT